MSAKTPEQEAAIRAIRKQMEFWRISPDELAGEDDAPTPRPVAAVVAQPKYRHPQSGLTWDGVGRQPEWLRLALTHEGYMVEELRIPDAEPPQ
jgi:DNA-binding protein H-NS